MDTDPRRTHQNPTARCPMCRGDFRLSDLLSASELEKQRVSNSGNAEEVQTAPAAMADGPPPKVAALLQKLDVMRAEGNDRRAVVFSQFTSFLDIIEDALNANDWSTARIDGSRTADQRADAMRALRDGTARVLLVSTRAGGQGLNLTAASRVFLMDLWWNEAVEAQAWDRVHRLGQKLPVTVVRFVAEDTLEEKLLQLQESKAAIGSGALRKLTASEAAKARVADLRALFSVAE